MEAIFSKIKNTVSLFRSGRQKIEETMPKKSSASNKPTTVIVGNISDISGKVNIAGRDIYKHQTTAGLSAAEIKQLFDELYTAIETRPETPLKDKSGLKAEVEEIQSTVIEAVKKIWMRDS